MATAATIIPDIIDANSSRTIVHSIVPVPSLSDPIIPIPSLFYPIIPIPSLFYPNSLVMFL